MSEPLRAALDAVGPVRAIVCPNRAHHLLEQHRFAGVPLVNEVVFSHPATRTLLLTDLAFNVPVGGTKGARFFCWLSGTEGRFGPASPAGFFMVRDREAARASLARILARDFNRLTATHGEVLERGGRAALRGFRFLDS